MRLDSSLERKSEAIKARNREARRIAPNGQCAYIGCKAKVRPSKWRNGELVAGKAWCKEHA